ncbi:MAG: hypothetical protein ACRCTY_01855 [Candidatus Adiutrix sp.]
MMELKRLISKTAQTQIDLLHYENSAKWATETKWLKTGAQIYKDDSQTLQNKEIARLRQIQATNSPIAILLAERTLIKNEYSLMLKRAELNVHINEVAISSLRSAAEKIGLVEEAVSALIRHPKYYQAIMVMGPPDKGMTPSGAFKNDRVTHFCSGHLTRLTNRNKYTGGTASDSEYIKVRAENISHFQKQYCNIREMAAKDGTTPYESLLEKGDEIKKKSKLKMR